MNVNNILKIALRYINKDDLIKVLNDNVDLTLNNELQTLLELLNITLHKIATEYVPCLTKEVIKVDSTEKYNVSLLSKQFYAVRSLKNSIGLSTKYREEDNCLILKPGKYELTYLYLPESFSFNDTIMCFSSVIIEEFVALGLVAEYFLKYGFFDEYEIYEFRFQEKMRKCLQKYNELKWKGRIWR